MKIELSDDNDGYLKGRATGEADVVDVAVHPGEDATNDVIRVEKQLAYETVAASQTAQVIGTTGAVGDHIDNILIVPATTSPGNVLLLDNATSITIFTGGAVSVADLKPILLNDLGYTSVSGAWKITTGANVSVVVGYRGT